MAMGKPQDLFEFSFFDVKTKPTQNYSIISVAASVITLFAPALLLLFAISGQSLKLVPLVDVGRLSILSGWQVVERGSRIVARVVLKRPRGPDLLLLAAVGGDGMTSGHGRVGQLYDLHTAAIHLERVGDRRRRRPFRSIGSAWETISSQ